jgi:hypothetical protein
MSCEPNIMDRFSVVCGRPDRNEKCKVSALFDGKTIHLGHFNPYGQFQRGQFAKAVSAKLHSCIPGWGEYWYWRTPEGNDYVELVCICDAVMEAADASERDDGTTLVPRIVMADQVEARTREWLWPKRIVLGGVNMLVGLPDHGKSLISLDIAARISRGACWPDCGEPAPLGGVIILSGEDDPETTIRPRLDAAGADCARIALLRGVGYQGTIDDGNRLVQLDTDIAQVEAATQNVADCRLLIVDPVSAYMGSADDHKNAQVRGVLSKLSDLAARLRLAVLLISHPPKQEYQHAVHRVSGSQAYAAHARMVWMAAWNTVQGEDGKPRKRRIIVLAKGNLTDQRTGLEYRITRRDGENPEPHIEWLSEPVELTADDALSDTRGKPGPRSTKLAEAMDWLREVLENGPQLATDVEAKARDAGIAKSTLDRAKRDLKVESYRIETPGPWYWILPNPKDANGSRDGELDDLDVLGNSSADSHLGDIGEYQDRQDVESSKGDLDDESWLHT